MRRVAAELGAGTMTLYYYVRSKDELVDLIDDAIMAEVLIPDGELPSGWREALSEIARRTRAMFVRHPWALLSLREAWMGPNAMRHFEQSLAAVADAPLDVAGRIELFTIVDDYVFGHALRRGETRRRAAAEGEGAEAALEFAVTHVRSGSYPHLQALMGDADPRDAAAQNAATMTDERQSELQFERGLRDLLDGAALRMGA
jgi:AcrR family transcriptional regulator